MEFQVSDRMKNVRGSAIREIFKFAADPSVISLAGYWNSSNSSSPLK